MFCKYLTLYFLYTCSIYSRLIDLCKIDEFGTNYSKVSIPLMCEHNRNNSKLKIVCFL